MMHEMIINECWSQTNTIYVSRNNRCHRAYEIKLLKPIKEVHPQNG